MGQNLTRISPVKLLLLQVFNEHFSSPLYHLRTISEATNKNVCVKLLEEVNANYKYLGNRNYSDNEVCQIIDAVKLSGTVKSELTSRPLLPAALQLYSFQDGSMN